MMRSFLIYLSKAVWARRILTGWGVARRAASRFYAGVSIEDAIQKIKALNDRGINATLDHLGEHTTNREEAQRATQDLIDVIEAIQKSGVRSNVSLKLTQLGLAVDQAMCAENLSSILACAQKYKMFVRIDMEESSLVDTTLNLYNEMRRRGFDNVGVVIQSYLYRSQRDIEDLLKTGTHVRLCKGAYKEPADVAFPKKKDVDANYDRLADLLIEGEKANGLPEATPDGRIPPIPGIASHDIRRIEHAKNYARQVKLPQNAIEFQMLYGIRRDLQEKLAEEGYPVRVYVPYGTEWYPYYMRRLAERPSNVWFFISNFFKG
ncbi:MAG: proline dehydrogenase family protein [Omnitrophica WOR_2 bacterium]